MLSFTSNSLGVLVMVGGILSPCAWPDFARAGDKIEFSAPSTTIEVPKVERDDKEPSKSDFTGASPGNRGGPLDAALFAPQVVVITPARRRDDRIFDPAHPEDQVDADDIDGNYDDMDSSRHSAARRDDGSGGLASYNETTYFERRNDESIVQDSSRSLRSRMEAEDARERSVYPENDRFGARSPGFDPDSAESRDYLHQGITPETTEPKLSTGPYDILHQGLSRYELAEQKSMASYDPLYAGGQQFNQRYSPQRLPGPSDDLQRSGYPPVPGTDPYSLQSEDLRQRTQDEPGNAPLIIHQYEPTSVSLNPDVFARQEPPPSPRGQVQSQPAILPFPKRPGDVLR